MTTSIVGLTDIHKSCGPVEVLKGISLDVAPGEVICLIGPSGSGKNTLLRSINHLEKTNAGEIRVDGNLVGYRELNGRLFELSDKETSKSREDVGMVLQHFNLFPHMTVLENLIEAPLRVRKENKAEATSRAQTLLARVGLEEKADSYPEQLSGGQ
ncbi:amino acid ABC transporter ATP-binding protein [Paenarthrobacter nitroguajacolicus]|uniref:amino acid ABC transporter ATP-binding protein n=1 Tax=Paenarthrobacter nitroguajacolicus TaxID=211146 RepID=UPI0034366894